MLKTLLYKSTNNNFDRETIGNILESSRKNNKELGVTGALCVSKDFFIQCLEGADVNVDKIYKKIEKDPRHSNIVLIDAGGIEEKKFHGWHMAYTSIEGLNEEELSKLEGALETPKDELYALLLLLVKNKEALFPKY